MLVFVSLGLTGPVMSLYLQSLGASTVIIGLMFAVFGVGEGIFGFVWGSAADRIGIGMPLLVQMFVGALCYVAFGAVSALVVLFVLRFVLAAVGSAMYPIGRGFLANAVPADRKGTAMALFAVMSSAGMSIGSTISGVLASQLGYPSVFYAAAALGTIAGVIVVFELRNETIAHKSDGEPIVAGELPPPRRSSARPLFILSLITALGTAASSSGITFTPLLMTEYAGVPVSAVGYAFGISGLVGIFLVLFAGGLSDRVGRKPVLILGFSMMLPGLLGLVFLRDYWPIVACMLLTSLGFSITFPPILTLMSNVTPKQYQGRSQGIFVVAIDSGIIFGPVVTGWLWAATGPAGAYLYSAALVAITFAITLIFVQERRWLSPQPVGLVPAAADA
jgi:DHA1 family multidrug resistance protein-like MFS transporter